MKKDPRKFKAPITIGKPDTGKEFLDILAASKDRRSKTS